MSLKSSTISISPIATINTPFKQKFAIPRQPNLTRAPGRVFMHSGFDDPNIFKGIEGFSHLWLLFIFHQTIDKGWKPAVKAPRLGGNQTLGVFASRATHRPNGIGMSVVANKGWYQEQGKLWLDVEGVDLVDGTPIVDIKPYVPYADSLPHATDNLLEYGEIPTKEVVFCDSVLSAIAQATLCFPNIKSLLIEVLRQDPRPAYRHKKDNDDKTYYVTLYDFDIGFIVIDGNIKVVEFTPLKG